MVKLVLFDIDGTLIRTGGAGLRAFERTAATQFDRPNGTSHLKFAGRTDLSLVREFFTYHGIDPTPENFRRFFDHYVFLLEHHLQSSRGALCEGVAEFIHDLSQIPNAPSFGLLTGNIRLGAEIKLRHFNLWDRFQTGAFGDDHEDRNRLAAIALERGTQLRKAPLRGDDVVVIGDTPLDIACARAIGAKALAVATGGATLEVLRSHQPDWAVPDLRGVSAREVCSGAPQRAA